MNFSLVLAYASVVVRELWQHKFLVFVCFAAVNMAVLAVGIQWPVKFETSTTIFADNQNILKPLLARQAAVTRVQDQTRIVQDVIHSPRILRDVVESVYSLSELESAAELDRLIAKLRNNIGIKGLGSSYIKINYSDDNPEKTYQVINAVVDRFIKDSSDSRRAESKEAFLFIDKQVKQYKEQLLLAEERLKEFNSANVDGRDSDVDSRISTLRSTIEEMKITIDEGRSRIAALGARLKEEDRYNAKKYRADVYRERLKSIQDRINTLLLTYKENYPDVVSLKAQADDVKQQILAAEKEDLKSSDVTAVSSRADQQGDLSVNPLYEELRSKLADSKISLDTRLRRLEATEQLLAKEYDRRKRIASRQAELAELTRDYNVTKKIYDDMLERKEKARLSMTLNIEGQGISYKIQEPAIYPNKPIGIRFIHFFLVAPFISLLVPLALIIAYVLVDPRFRLVTEIEEQVSVPVLAAVPHIKTPLAKRLLKKDMILLMGLCLLLLAVNIAIAFAYKTGII